MANAVSAINSGGLAHYNYVATLKSFDENDEAGFNDFIRVHDSVIVEYYNPRGPHVVAYSTLDHVVYDGGLLMFNPGGLAATVPMDKSTLFMQMTAPRRALVIDKKN
jgi:hypothetical protein